MTAHKKSRHISILGAGKIGQAVAKLWIRSGHSICFGSRNPEKLAAIVQALGSQASAKSLKIAASEGEIILLAVPYAVVDELVMQVSSELSGKIVLDATNPFGISPEGHIISTLDSNTTAGSRMAMLLPNSRVIKAFTHIMDELLVSRGISQAGLFAMAIAGDDSNAKFIAAQLVRDAGYVPIDIGILAESAPLDPGGILFPHMYTAADMRAMLSKSR